MHLDELSVLVWNAPSECRPVGIEGIEFKYCDREKDFFDEALTNTKAYDCLLVLPGERETSSALNMIRHLRTALPKVNVPPVVLVSRAECIDIASDIFDKVILGPLSDAALATILKWSEQGRKLRDLADAYEKLLMFQKMVVHDLRSPLVALGAMKVLVDQSISPDSPAHEILNQMQIACDATLQVLDSLLLLCAKTQASPTTGSAAELLADIEAELAARFRSAGVTLDIDVARHGFEIKVDRDLLRRALINLLDNALRYTPSGKKVSVEICMGDGTIYASVADEGPGFHDQHRGDAGAAMPLTLLRYGEKGQLRAGIGLESARFVAKAHNGELVVENRNPLGSIVTLRLPRLPLTA